MLILESGGDWAGNASVYSSSGCPSTCVSEYMFIAILMETENVLTNLSLVGYVNSNPSAFKNAYWDIASLRVYA